MTSRERVLTAIDHRMPDRVPVDFGWHRSSGIAAIAYAKLKKTLNLTTGDIYEVLPRRTPSEIARHVHGQLAVLSPGGGFVFQQVYNILADVPPRNILAMFEAVRNFDPEEDPSMTEQIKINWYRCKVDRAVMSELMRKSDARGFAQVIPQLLLFVVTAALAYLAFLNVHAATWRWSLPLLLLALFVHGTFSRFFFGIAGHELAHKTPFRTQAFNEFFLKVYSFLSWFDYVGYRVSHVKHHQLTVHSGEDGEVVLPQGLDWHGIRFIFMELTVNPARMFGVIRSMAYAAFGDVSCNGFFRGEWLTKILPESDAKLRREHRRWARAVVFGQLAIAAVFAATGHWFLIIVVNLGCHYCDWLQLLCGAPQHIGMAPNVADFRLCTRTYTCGRFPAFLYWNMQYHLEHHMFPAVPFYNLPRLRKAIEHDLPPAPLGLWATWREILPIMKRQRVDRSHVFVPRLPGDMGDRVEDGVIRNEAAQKTE